MQSSWDCHVGVTLNARRPKKEAEKEAFLKICTDKPVKSHDNR